MTDFQMCFVDVKKSTYHDEIIRKVTQQGIATFNISSRDQLREIAQGLGEVYVEDDTDETGVKVVHNSANGSRIHTDRSSHQEPPNVIIVWCQQQSEQGGDSIFADGKKIYDDLCENHPTSLQALSQPLSAYFGYPDYASAAAIFNRNADDSVFLKFRYDRWGYYSADAIPHLPNLFNLIEKHQFQIRLESGQGYVCANRRYLHGALAGQGQADRIVYRMIVNCQRRTADGVSVAMGFNAD